MQGAIWRIAKASLLGLALIFSSLIGQAHEPDKHDQAITASLAVSVVVDGQGRLWQVSVKDGHVWLAGSKDLGKTFSQPIKVNPERQKITARGELRPRIAIGQQGEIYVTWMQNLNKRFAGHIWLARSLDQGKSFEKPIIVHQDRSELGHAFETLVVAPDGTVTVIWLDARDLAADKAAGKPRKGSAVYYAVSTDAAKTFSPEKKLADYSCECCRIAAVAKPDSTVTVMWRHVFKGNERDHMMAEIPRSGQAVALKRVTFGHWVFDGCPHHGPAMAIGGEGQQWWGYHMAYFDGQDKKPGLYYSRMDGEAWVTFPAKRFGDHAKQARHPALLSANNEVWLAWLETHANRQVVMGMHSTDEGKSWSASKVLLDVSGKVDYPQLIRFQDVTYLAVNTEDGLKITAMTP